MSTESEPHTEEEAQEFASNSAAAVPEIARKALFNGLEILRILVESREPLMAREVARRCGLHQSSVSRILQTLAAAGYVRKPSYRSFTVDYGILTLSAQATRHFQLMEKPRAAIAALARREPAIAVVALTTVWKGHLVYLLRTSPELKEPATLSLGGYPLHLSSPGLRILLEMPEEEALRWLEDSKQRLGWERPTPQVPRTAPLLLKAARKRMQERCLILDDWQKPGWLGAAIDVNAPNEPPCALSISIGMSEMSIPRAIALLKEYKTEIEATLVP